MTAAYNMSIAETIDCSPYCQDPPDVTLIINETEIPAHRSILSDQSEYFKAMFSNSFIEATSKKVVLKEINLKAFCVVYKYIYIKHSFAQLNEYLSTDALKYETLSFEELFEILACAHYLLVDFMIDAAIWRLKARGEETPGLLMNAAFEYSDDDFIFFATNRMLKKKKIFEDMSAAAVEYLLKERIDAPESVIFEALVRWMRVNPYYWYLFAGFLEHIDLYLLEKRHFDMLVEPINLVDRNFCQKLLTVQKAEAKDVQKIEDKNVINDDNKLRVVEGYVESRHPEEWFNPNKKNHVVIDLKKLFLINCVKLKLSPEVGSYASYTVSVSTDMRNWECVIDHSKYFCFGQQVLYFLERNVRFIRIQSNSRFSMETHVEALYSTEPPTIDPVTTLTVPHRNVIELKDFPKWSCDMRGLLTGVYLRDGEMSHRICRQGVMFYRFAQPYMINSFSFLLKEKSSFNIEIFDGNDGWKVVLQEYDVSGWRIARFKKQPVTIIKIVGIDAPTEAFYMYNFECPAYSGNHCIED
uniref:BTB domain-containing protein n=1 Tax=Panagrellus redivivus TaxID=6233 RepID=A0A7E4W8T9_PANRE